MGWVFTWVSLAWIVLGIMDKYTNSPKQGQSVNNFTSYQQLSQTDIRRWSGDSGQGTERNSSISSPMVEQDNPAFHENDEVKEFASHAGDDFEKGRLFHGTRLDLFLSKHVHKYVIGNTLTALRFVYNMFERTLILLGFCAFCSGFVTCGGIFRGIEVFSGLAHFVKGGIFFWIGILAIGRWAGAFADLGWAWNVKPPSNRWIPTSEFVESALICLYGASNVWLEHLAAWGEEWTPMDYEHVSITILFFGAGLLGMLIESKRVRRFLNAGLVVMRPSNAHYESGFQPTPDHPTWSQPETASTPLNPLPALTILLLGLIMSAHSQHSMLAATMHTMWGALFAFGAAGRMCTYILNYLRPPISYIPSRPPTELIAGFTLVAGGFMFMISARDITDALEGSGADAMVALVVALGFSAVICAWTVACMGAKGWAVAREHREQLQSQDEA